MGNKPIFIFQVISLLFIWLLFSGIAIWVINLLRLSTRLHDAPSATIGISIVAIPIFFTLASILTYVFWGLHKYSDREQGK